MGSFTAALMATAARLRAQAGQPAEKDLLAAAVLVLATALTRMLEAARQEGGQQPAGAEAGTRQAVIAACLLLIGARSFATAAAAEGWPVPPDVMVAETGRIVLAHDSLDETTRLLAGGAQTLAAMEASGHPRAAEIAAQVAACFTLFAHTGEARAIDGLAALYGALSAAARA